MTLASNSTPAADPGGDCAFCHHPQAIHTGNPAGRTGCAAPVCGNARENLGRCAVYTSPARAAANARWFAAYESPATVMPAEVASRIHRAQFGGGEHSLALSCSCAHQAMALLGLDPESDL